MSNYFSQTNQINYQIVSERNNGRKISLEEARIVHSGTKGAFHQKAIQGVLAMSQEELEALKNEYCDILAKEQRKWPNEPISTLSGVYAAMTPEEFRYSLLHPSVLGTSGMTELKKYAINSASYINRDYYSLKDSMGMGYDYSEDDIKNSDLTEAMQNLIKQEAKQRAQDVKEKLESGMTLEEATSSELGYRNKQGISR